MRNVFPRIMMVLNVILLPLHIVLERMRGDLNWQRIGDRSPLSKAFMLTEGTAALFLMAALFISLYPNMMMLIRSKLTRVAAAVLIAEFCVWFLYK